MWGLHALHMFHKKDARLRWVKSECIPALFIRSSCMRNQKSNITEKSDLYRNVIRIEFAVDGRFTNLNMLNVMGYTC